MKEFKQYIIEKFKITKDIINNSSDSSDIVIKCVKEIISRESILQSSHFYYDVSKNKDFIYISSSWYEKNELQHIEKILKEYLNNKKYNISSCFITYDEDNEMIILHNWKID